jgi:hypothetical protein
MRDHIRQMLAVALLAAVPAGAAAQSAMRSDLVRDAILAQEPAWQEGQIVVREADFRHTWVHVEERIRIDYDERESEAAATAWLNGLPITISAGGEEPLSGVGDHAFIWSRHLDSGAAVVSFRKGRGIVTVSGPSVSITTRFAQLVALQIHGAQSSTGAAEHTVDSDESPATRRLRETRRDLKRQDSRSDQSPNPFVHTWRPARRVAGFVGYSVPAIMAASHTYPVSVTFRNTNPEAWTPTDAIALGAADQAAADAWGLAEVPLRAAVFPDGEVTFDLTITAPLTPGTYPLAFRLRQNGEMFGAQSRTLTVAVQ